MCEPPSSHHRPFSISMLILIMTIGSSSSKTSAIISQHRPSSSSSSSATSPPACAACKYQRRKCNPDCTLAPYFPANQPRQFLNAHRLFGVSNILKIIRHLDPVHRADAMRSIIFQSNARAQDPVGGCHRIIRDLERQLQRDSDELALVRCHLAIWRSRAQDQTNIPGLLPKLPDNDGGGGDTATYDTHLVQQHCDNYFCYDGGGGVDHDDYGHADSLNMSINYRDTVELPSLQQQIQQCMVEEKYTKPLVDVFDIRWDIFRGKNDHMVDEKDTKPLVGKDDHIVEEKDTKPLVDKSNIMKDDHMVEEKDTKPNIMWDTKPNIMWDITSGKDDHMVEAGEEYETTR